jgi:hypothetical protein
LEGPVDIQLAPNALSCGHHSSVGVAGTSIVLSFENEYPSSCYLHGMPWKARLDTPGALHHIVVRGIERHNIFYDDNCRGDCLERLGAILVQSRTACYAWAVMPKHLRLVLRPGPSSILTRKRLILAGVK